MEPIKKKLGLIVNPLAGIGGRVGLKGSDGAETVRKAFDLGAEIVSPGRALETLKALIPERDRFELLTYPAEMGAQEAQTAGFEPRVLGSITPGQTTSADTQQAARDMRTAGADLIVFVGGDGTARDIHVAVGESIPVVGIPAGVKIHSSVYAVNPRRAADLVKAFLDGNAPTQAMEVMDIDEELFRLNRVSARLYGYLQVPFERRLIQGAKSPSTSSHENLRKIAAAVVERLDNPEMLYILGPGTTIKAIGDLLGIDKTLLGVDAVLHGQQVGKDLNEQQLLALVRERQAKIIVTVIGGQGYIFGRGNQQLSPAVLRAVGKKNLVVVAAKNKLIALNGPLLVDTGDPDCDLYLSGFMRVVTGFNEETVWKVEC